ncbi:MAG: peptidoglycan-binding protein [Clostridia bacterium]|nr:peptidoglycan-binding protein [Clostridia bacterium]
MSTEFDPNDSYGVLRINTFLQNIAYPADNARVVISYPQGDVIAEYNANEEGQLPPIRLPSPPLDYSQDYDRPRPFSQYDVTASLPGYNDVSISNVQIYPDTTAVQNIGFVSTYDDIDIPYPVLWGDYPDKIPESEIKKLPFPSNLVVLPEPVIPEYIIVHDGVPSDSSASNYTLPFKDYINNVASSEIYATWGREALKANILAIISFTLSRVYTEWYRSKGYDFTITSSTAYDQAFFYGRNIFQEIADVTDEVFNLYISRSDIGQPLFTQYCDGRRVKREGWLSQWGSADLAKEGYTAIQILKYYYGYDIILKEARKVQGIPISFPGVLRTGSRGENVRVIQSQLNRISNNFPLISKLAVDGIYGPKTESSVRTFQQIFSLPATGVVNFPTWYKISDIFNAVSSA